MLRTTEKIASVTTKITSRQKKPWYDEDLQNQRKIMKTEKGNGSNTEMINTGKHTKGNKIDFVTMLRYKKCNIIHNLINANTTESKKLHKLITEVTGQNKQNLLPESTSDQQLAKDLTAFFSNKIPKHEKTLQKHTSIHTKT